MLEKHDRVERVYDKKVGTIRQLRSDDHEQRFNWSRGQYWYYVDWLDGSFDTYVSESSLTKL